MTLYATSSDPAPDFSADDLQLQQVLEDCSKALANVPLTALVGDRGWVLAEEVYEQLDMLLAWARSERRRQGAES